MVGKIALWAAATAAIGIFGACSESIDSRTENHTPNIQSRSPESYTSQQEVAATPEDTSENELDAALNRVMLSLTADATADDAVKQASPSASPSPSPSASPSGSAESPSDSLGKITDAVFKLSDKIIAKLLQIFDADKNGKISKTEILSMIMQKQEKFLDKFSAVIKDKCGDQKDKDMSPRCSKLLIKFDADKDGKLSDSEIAEIEKAKLEKMAKEQEKWVLSVAARLCLNNLNLCEQSLIDELKAADANNPSGILDRLQGLISKFKRGVKQAPDSKTDADKKDENQDQKK
jgi:Ca2+-binding EF-hand superfamily protein